jgi:hypothetical protein
MKFRLLTMTVAATLIIQGAIAQEEPFPAKFSKTKMATDWYGFLSRQDAEDFARMAFHEDDQRGALALLRLRPGEDEAINLKAGEPVEVVKSAPTKDLSYSFSVWFCVKSGEAIGNAYSLCYWVDGSSLWGRRRS